MSDLFESIFFENDFENDLDNEFHDNIDCDGPSWNQPDWCETQEQIENASQSKIGVEQGGSGLI